MNPRALSPRNSSRSYDCALSSTRDGCMNTCRSRAAGNASINLTSCPPGLSPLLVARDVVDGLSDGGDALGILVGDLDPELILELHDQLDEIERIGVEILLERRRLDDVGLLDAELLHQNHLYSLEDFLARSCHVTSLSRRNLRWPGC